MSFTAAESKQGQPEAGPPAKPGACSRAPRCLAAGDAARGGTVAAAGEAWQAEAEIVV